MKSKKHSILLYVISGVLLVLTVMMGIVLWLIMNLEPQPSHVLKVGPATVIEQVVEQSTHHDNKRDQTIVMKEKVVEIVDKSEEDGYYMFDKEKLYTGC